MALRVLAFLALIVLAACGSRSDDAALGYARGLVSGALNREAAAPAVDPRQVLSRAQINQAATPLILVENLNFGTVSTMARVGVNGPNETWRGADAVTLALTREGVLRQTRGFGDDLMAADVAATRAALAGRHAGPIARTHVRVLSDLDEERIGYQCHIQVGGAEQVDIFGDVRSLTRVTETCRAPAGAQGFENRYWVDAHGFAWASEQFAGPALGHFRIERLFR